MNRKCYVAQSFNVFPRWWLQGGLAKNEEFNKEYCRSNNSWVRWRASVLSEAKRHLMYLPNTITVLSNDSIF